jgi:hypothetical protein
MAKVPKHAFSLPTEPATAIEQWLRDEVVAVYDAMKADPACKLSAKAVFAEVRARYTKRRETCR